MKLPVFVVLIFLCFACENEVTQAIVKQNQQRNAMDEAQPEKIDQVKAEDDAVDQDSVPMPKSNPQKKVNPEKQTALLVSVAESSETGNRSKRPVTKITNTFSETEKFLAFKHQMNDPGDPRVGCSQSEEDFTFSVSHPAEESFLVNIDDSEQIPFSYDFSGGLLFASGQKLLSGFIKGQKNEDGSWDIHVDLQVEMKDLHTGKIYPKQILFRQAFVKQ